MPLIEGDAGDDRIRGSDGEDTILGHDGNDRLRGLAGNDGIDGGAGDDTIFGGEGDDRLFGGDAFDADRLFGGDGNDNLGGYGGDTLDGGAGVDNIGLTLFGLEPAYFDLSTLIDGGEVALNANTTLIDVETGSIFLGGGDDAVRLGDTEFLISGNGGNDRIIGGGGNTFLYGDAGDDTISPGAGSDYVSGGSGRDTVSYADAAAAVTIDLEHYGGSVVGADGSAFLAGIESAVGSAFGDLIGGSAGRNDLFGGDGDDRLNGGSNTDQLFGGDGTDALAGGRGGDRLDGGAGRDTYVYAATTDSNTYGTDLIVKLLAKEVIDLAAIDADTTTAGDQAFVLSQALTGQAGQVALRYDAVKRLTYIEGDVNGDGVADLAIAVNGSVTWFDNFVL